jgi:hypothetical protein
METEEDTLTPWNGAFSSSAIEIVPGDKRVMVKEILFDMQRREATLRCGTRGIKDGDPDSKAKEIHICW